MNDIDEIGMLYACEVLEENIAAKALYKFAPIIGKAALSGIILALSQGGVQAAEEKVKEIVNPKDQEAINTAIRSITAKDDFINRAEQLISFLETGVRPKAISADSRAQLGQLSRLKQYGQAYYYAIGGKNMGPDIYKMSYEDLSRKYGRGAKGKYQIISSTYKEFVDKGLYKHVPNAKHDFSPETQDQIFEYMSNKKQNFKKAIEEFQKGNVNKSIWYLSREWASIPKDATDLSYYDGDGRNKALASFKDVKDFLTGKIEITGVDKL
tara:strand:- start:104 stop:907 length:804 start_codon:yes stop_codon:yes gene_type:complete